MMRMISILALPAMILGSGPGLADGIDWDVRPDFRNDEAALEISGIACAGKDGKQEWCYAVNDEKKYVQLFEIKNRTLVPGKRLRILNKEDAAGNEFAEPDLEAVAYHRDFLYLAGSHGASRKKGEVHVSRFFVFRLPVKDSGKPDFKIDDDDVASQIERSAGLRSLIKSAEGVAEFAEKSPDENGANIEGMGLLDEAIYFGFRAPVAPRGAVILKVSIGTLFAGAAQPAESFFVDIGAGYGVRDMAPLEDGFLILAGAAGDADLVPAIWFWRPDTRPRLLRILRVPALFKAEGLMVLDRKDREEVRVLVVFDSQKNGAPREFAIPHP